MEPDGCKRWTAARETIHHADARHENSIRINIKWRQLHASVPKPKRRSVILSRNAEEAGKSDKLAAGTPTHTRGQTVWCRVQATFTPCIAQ